MKINIKHKFGGAYLPTNPKILFLGTFNPKASGNNANFFYSRPRNYFWQLLPIVLKKQSLKNALPIVKKKFLNHNHIALMDLIYQINVPSSQSTNYADAYIDKYVSKWNCKKLIYVINKYPIKHIFFTRKTFTGIPNMKKKINQLEKLFNRKKIIFSKLPTPARYAGIKKQEEWNKVINGSLKMR